MTPAVSTAALALTDATLEQLLAAVQARFEREYSKTTPYEAERLSDKELAKAWRTYDEFCRGFQRVGKKYEENRKVLNEEMEKRDFVAKNEDEGIVGTVIGLTRRLFGQVIGKKRTSTAWQEAWDAFYATTAEGSPERTLLDQIKTNKTKTTVTLGFKFLDYDPSEPA